MIRAAVRVLVFGVVLVVLWWAARGLLCFVAGAGVPVLLP
jgi:hypothetical protein